MYGWTREEEEKQAGSIFLFLQGLQAGMGGSNENLARSALLVRGVSRSLDNSTYDACIMSVNATLTVQLTI